MWLFIKQCMYYCIIITWVLLHWGLELFLQVQDTDGSSEEIHSSQSPHYIDYSTEEVCVLWMDVFVFIPSSPITWQVQLQ